MSDSNNIRIGDILEWGEDKYSMKCVFRTLLNDKTYVLLHPADAPDDIQFVPMCLMPNGTLKPETNRSVCETLVELYSQFRIRHMDSEEE